MELDPLASPFDTQEGDIFALEQPSIDLNRQIATNEYGGALKYSQLPPEDQAVVDARRALSAEKTAKDAELFRTENPDFNMGEWYRSQDFNSIDTSNLERQAFQDFDPNRGALAGTNAAGWAKDQVEGQPFVDMLRKSGASYGQKTAQPLKIDYPHGYDADTLYMKVPETGGNTSMHQGFSTEELKKHQDLERRGSFIDISGGKSSPGDYSMMWIQDPPEASHFEKFLNNPAVNIMASVIPGGQVALTLAKGASGQTLHGGDWATLGMAGLNKAGLIEPPTGAGANGMGPVDTGKGLFGTTYNQTQALVSAAAADDLEGGLVQVFAPEVIKGIKGQLPQLDIPETGLPENFEAGLTKTVEKMVGGASFEDAIKAGGIEYIKEGGLKPLEKIIKEAVKPLGGIVDPVKDAFAVLDKNVLQPITKPVGDVLSAADTTVRQELSEFDKEVLQPVTKPVADALSAADTAVRDALPSFGSLGIDLPKIGLGMLTGGSTLSPTRTTDDIFKDDLFKFKTKIGVSPVEQLLRSPQAQQQEVVGLYDDPFASSFNERNTF